MKNISLLVMLLLMSANVWALDLDISGDYYVTPNPERNTHEDAWGAHVRVSDQIKNELYWFAEGGHITDMRYQSGSDDLGEARGYLGLGGLIFKPETNWDLKPYFFAGAGAGTWEFKESPFLQDEGITIDMDVSLVTKVGGGVEYIIDDKWTVQIESGWFQTKIGVSCTDDGVSCNLPDDDPTGVEFIPISVAGKYKF